MQGGTEDQILATYRQTIGALYGYVSRHCGGDRTLAEDVTQETRLRAVRERRRKGVPARPIAWLTTVARNLLVSYYRRKRPSSLISFAGEVLAPWTKAGRAGLVARTAVVCHALARLPPDQAQLLEDFHFRGIGGCLRLPSNWVCPSARWKDALRRARQKLRRELEAIMKIKSQSMNPHVEPHEPTPEFRAHPSGRSRRRFAGKAGWLRR
jgi:DNA-directed RNA polymerase specialized sigma24 family protein